MPGDKASAARTLFFRYEGYADRWDELAAIFSRDAVLKGSFDKYADTSRKKRGTAEVDDAFLEEIERWRDVLARNFGLRNPGITVRDLNFAVQKTIDRLIFLRICEDRGTEDYGCLLTLQNGANCYPRLLEEIRRADDRYMISGSVASIEGGEPRATLDVDVAILLAENQVRNLGRQSPSPITTARQQTFCIPR